MSGMQAHGRSGPSYGGGKPMFDLVWSKLRRPLARPGSIRRTALLEKLDSAGSGPVVSVQAPAGYGKTTLLAQWAENNGKAVAWVSVDEKDNDPKVLLTYVAKALDAIEPVGGRVFDALAAPASSVPGSVVPRLGSALASMSTPVLLVLDDVHLLSDLECQAAVSALADHVPKGARLVLAGRGEPPVRVARLRSEGRILQIGPAELAMTGEEAARLLRAAEVRPGPDELAELYRRTGGWPAGLYLAALAVRAGGPLGVASSGDLPAAEDLAAQYLSRIPVPQREFLTRTAVLDRICGPLCEAVLERPGAAATLAGLAGSNLLLVPLDRLGRWYRYHPMFRDMLLAELERAEPGTAPVLRRHAARWCRDNGLPEEALEYTMAAGDVDEAARLVQELAQPAEREDRLTALPRWYRWLDDRDGIEGHPMVAVWAAFFALETGQPAEAERWAAMADRGPDGPDGPGAGPAGAWAAVLRASLCHHGAGQMRADADEAARKLAGAGIAAPVAPLVQAIARIADGDPGQAGSYLDQAASAAEDAGAQSVLALALCERSLLALARDDWGAGQSLAERAGLVLREAGLEDSNAAPLVFAVQARMVLHRRDVDGARRALVSAQRRRHLLSYAMPCLAVQLRIELIGTYLELADLAGARTLVREIDGLLAHQPDLGALTAEAHALRDRLAAERGTGAAGPSALTAAELRLLPLLSTHLSSAGIGADLSWPASTVRSRAASICRKLGAADRSAAVARSRELGLLDR
jgi:LuxR family transcriptional regulator, maltose regulon positive regulatory protein